MQITSKELFIYSNRLVKLCKASLLMRLIQFVEIKSEAGGPEAHKKHEKILSVHGLNR